MGAPEHTQVVTLRPGWLKRRAAAAWSGLSVATIDRLVSADKVLSRQKGKSRLINVDSLDELIQSDDWLEKGGVDE